MGIFYSCFAGNITKLFPRTFSIELFPCRVRGIFPPNVEIETKYQAVLHEFLINYTNVRRGNRKNKDMFFVFKSQVLLVAKNICKIS